MIVLVVVVAIVFSVLVIFEMCFVVFLNIYYSIFYQKVYKNFKRINGCSILNKYVKFGVKEIAIFLMADNSMS